MALRDRPYLPLFVQDFMTDEKLANCTAESTGVYIRLMCLMHKSEEYGTILLRQKFRQTGRQLSDFAELLARQMPYKTDVIERSLTELLDEGVIFIDGEKLCQKRMMKDAKLSETRARAGKEGADATNNRRKKKSHFAEDFAASKNAANTENENEYEYEDDSKKDIGGLGGEERERPFDGELGVAFSDWLAYKREKRQSYKPTGLKSLITQVRKHAEQYGDAATIEAIRNSMASNYQGIIFDRAEKSGAVKRRAKASDEYRGKDFWDD